MTSIYKINPALLQSRMDAAVDALAGQPLRATFIAQTLKIVKAKTGNYLRFGPYWFAVKRILKSAGHDFGPYTVNWLEGEYSVSGANGVVDAAETLLSAWIFAEDNTFSPEKDWEIEGNMWSIEDADMV